MAPRGKRCHANVSNDSGGDISSSSNNLLSSNRATEKVCCMFLTIDEKLVTDQLRSN